MSASASASASASSSAAASAARRQSMMPSSGAAGPKAPAHFASNITVADSSILVGSYPITISSETVVHPRARLDSASGPVNIGRRCIIHERSHVGASPPAPAGAEGSVTLADFVTVEVGAVVETGGTFVGEGTVLGVKSRVGRGASVGRHCTLAPQTVVAPGEKIPDFTVIYSNGLRRQDKRGVSELRGKAQARQIEVLRRLIPSNPAKFA